MHLKPGLGKHQLRRLPVPTIQAFLNDKIKSGQSVRNVQKHDRERLGAAWTDTGLTFTTRTGAAGLLEGFLAGTRLDLTPFCNPKN